MRHKVGCVRKGKDLKELDVLRPWSFIGGSVPDLGKRDLLHIGGGILDLCIWSFNMSKGIMERALAL